MPAEPHSIGAAAEGRADRPSDRSGSKQDGFFSVSGLPALFAAFGSIAFIGVLAGALAGLFDPVPDQRQNPKFDLSADPPLGKALPIPETDLLGRKMLPERPGRVMLVAAGPCTEYSVKGFAPERFNAAGFSRIVLIFESAPSEIRAQAGKLPDPYRVLCDENLAWHRKLNVQWTPRFYELSNDWRLSLIQRDPDSMPEEYNREEKK
jgi:hypothetical protein